MPSIRSTERCHWPRQACFIWVKVRTTPLSKLRLPSTACSRGSSLIVILVCLSIRLFFLHVREEILHVLAAFRSHFADESLGHVIFSQGPSDLLMKGMLPPVYGFRDRFFRKRHP